MLLKNKTCYAFHKNDVGKISTPFRIRLKPNAQLITQRPSKVPIHYRDKLNALLKELEKHNILNQIGSSPQDKPVYGTTFLKTLIIIFKGDTIKCVLDARHRRFFGLKGLPNFFTKQMSTFFKTLIEQGFALVYIDDVLLLSDTKEHMFQLIEQLHIISTKNNLKLAPEKSFSMLLKIKFLGHEIGYNTIKPIHSKIALFIKSLLLLAKLL